VESEFARWRRENSLIVRISQLGVFVLSILVWYAVFALATFYWEVWHK
jgi:hypothetical protein